MHCGIWPREPRKKIRSQRCSAATQWLHARGGEGGAAAGMFVQSTKWLTFFSIVLQHGMPTMYAHTYHSIMRCCSRGGG